MIRFMLDSNVFDALVADDVTKAQVQQAISDGKIKIITTHIQEDEIAAIPDELILKREEISHIPVRLSPLTEWFLVCHVLAWHDLEGRT